MIQANYRLHLAGQGKPYLSYAERGLAFLAIAELQAETCAK